MNGGSIHGSSSTLPSDDGVQKVGIHGKRRVTGLVLRHGDLVVTGEVEQVGARLELPVTPWRDDLDIRFKA